MEKNKKELPSIQTQAFTSIAQFKKSIRQIKHAKKVFLSCAVLGGLLVILGSFLFAIDKSKDLYTLSLPSIQSDQKVLTQNQVQTQIKIAKKPALFNVQYDANPFVLVTIDDQEVFRKQLDFTKVDSIEIDPAIDANGFSDGVHTVQIQVLDEKNKNAKITSDNFSFEKDTQAPSSQTATMIDGKTAKVSVDESKKISVTDVKANAVMFSVDFSEPGTLSIENPKGSTITVDETGSKTATISIPDGQKPFTTAYHFKDKVGLESSGTVSYYYDNVPPKITFWSASPRSYTLPKHTTVQFKVDEGLKSSSVTFKGKVFATKLENGIWTTTEEADLDYGVNTVTITATDLSGNTSTQNFTITQYEPPKPAARAPTYTHSGCSTEDSQACDNKFSNICDHAQEWKDCLAKCGTVGIADCH